MDLLKGIGKLSGMKVIEVEGATGNYDTNFIGKAKACLNAFKDGMDYVYIHMEAPDECGHHGDLEHKIYSIEQIDNVVKIVVEGLKEMGEQFNVLICPDHPTPISIKTHCANPVPYLIYKSQNPIDGAGSYNEQTAKESNIFVSHGYELMNRLLK